MTTKKKNKPSEDSETVAFVLTKRQIELLDNLGKHLDRSRSYVLRTILDKCPQLMKIAS